MKKGRPKRKLSIAQAEDIKSFVGAHSWRGAINAIAKKHRVSTATIWRVRQAAYFTGDSNI